MRVALYARVSTSIPQEIKNGDLKGKENEVVFRQDPEVQFLKLREFAKNRGYEIVAEYQDRASGSDPNRQQLEEMMKAAFRREFDTILIVRLDRITRSLSNLLSLLQELESAKVNLIATDQNIELGSATGRLMIHLLGAFAEWEREIMSERIKDGIAKARIRGTKSGLPIGKPPKYSKGQLKRAFALYDSDPGIPLAELSRQTGINRKTLRRKLQERDGQNKGVVSL